jgi:hypothetical protein
MAGPGQDLGQCEVAGSQLEGGHFRTSTHCMGMSVSGSFAPSGQSSSGMPVLCADESLVDVLAERIAERLRPGGDGFLDAEGAARHLCTSRQRIHELTSARALRPDGYDGRRPLYRRASLDHYVEGGRR